MKAAGLATRDEAKTFIYAFLYGAGDAKIGSIVGGGASKGKAMKAAFLRNTPALAELREKISRIADQGSIPALDGRRLRVRHKHAALNTLLQGAGAIVMKRGLVIAHERLHRQAISWRLVAQVHDEIQAECSSLMAEHVGQRLVRGIVEAGKYYNMRCPLAAEAKIGTSWAETH
jgi:DNA polymerase I-like protein with 3'-5' exonuclease and polymerase domains